ncbi:MAG TPA: hypothetical protein O0X64_03760 [Methanocorpusculum sp.]|nr:hypothetical protein [Methanocorpusculum sp.]
MQLFGEDDRVSFVSFLLCSVRVHMKRSSLMEHPFYGAAKDHKRSEVMGEVQVLIVAEKLYLRGNVIKKLFSVKKIIFPQSLCFNMQKICTLKILISNILDFLPLERYCMPQD